MNMKKHLFPLKQGVLNKFNIYMRNLIINADDFGWNSENDKIMMKMLLDNTITSVSVMVNGSNIMVVREYIFMNILSFYLQNKHLSLGLHLNLTEGLPLIKSHHT